VKWVVEHRKAIAAFVIGAGLQLVDVGYIHGTAAHYVQVGAAVATALGVYQVRNGRKSLLDK
jgi:hypothetical protein